MTAGPRCLAVVLLVLAVTACAGPERPQEGRTCAAFDDLFRELERYFSGDVEEEAVTAAVDRLVAAANPSDGDDVRDAIRRADRAWPGRDGEAAPDLDFGRAVDDLADACVRQGWSYPELGRG